MDPENHWFVEETFFPGPIFRFHVVLPRCIASQRDVCSTTGRSVNTASSELRCSEGSSTWHQTGPKPGKMAGDDWAQRFEQIAQYSAL